jgi:hypothetical protein
MKCTDYEAPHYRIVPHPCGTFSVLRSVMSSKDASCAQTTVSTDKFLAYAYFEFSYSYTVILS